jgi:hypothetical protein
MLDRLMIGDGSGPENGYVLNTFSSSWTVACCAHRPRVRVSKSSDETRTVRFVINAPKCKNPKYEI